MRVDNLEINRNAACGPLPPRARGQRRAFQVRSRSAEYAPGATACCHIAHIARATRQIEQIAFGREVCRVDGFAQPALEKTEARYCVESRVLLRNIAEDMLHALFRNFGGASAPVAVSTTRSSACWASLLIGPLSHGRRKKSGALVSIQ